MRAGTETQGGVYGVCVLGVVSLKLTIAVVIFLRPVNTSLLPAEFCQLINPQPLVGWKYVN
jgi:hypothetical protein